jgi:hypothetical protein
MDASPSAKRRIDMRLNKVFPVVVGSELFGDSPAIARNISSGGMFVEMRDPPPIGSVVTVSFRPTEGRDLLRVRAEVKHHFCWNFQIGDDPASSRGIGLRFLEFAGDIDPDGRHRGEILH